MERPSWDDVWMAVARDVARRAPCSRARVGAVIVDETNRIIATGHNGPPADFVRPWEYDCDGREGGFCIRGKHGPQSDARSYTDCPSIHAEANALLFCDRRHRVGGTIYVTTSVCNACAKEIANSGLARIVIARDPGDAYRVPEDSYDFMRECGLEVDIIDA